MDRGLLATWLRGCTGLIGAKELAERLGYDRKRYRAVYRLHVGRAALPGIAVRWDPQVLLAALEAGEALD